MKKGQRKQGARSVHSPVQSLPFSFYNSYTLSASATAIPIYPSTFPRVLEVGDAFDCFKVSKLRYRLYPTGGSTASTVTGATAAAFYPGITDNVPAAVSDVCENPTRSIMLCRQTTPSPWVNVPATLLAGYSPWYKTIPGSVDPAEEIPGNVYLKGTSTEVANLEIEGVFLFKGAANTAATPMERAQLLRQRERERLLMILSTPAPPDEKDLKTSAVTRK